MILSPHMHPPEILAVAVRSEIEAAGVYSKLCQKVRNELLKKKLKFLVFEEKKHRQILERLFSQRYPRRKMQVPENSFLPPVKLRLDSKTGVLDVFKAALQAEKLSEDFYKQASQKIETKESQKILEYLSRVERGHYFMIKSEIGLLEKFPDYYDVKEFHAGHDMVHVGP
ncbi:MAG: ferritin-like domain-containing protein [Candidatus Aminicenantes bacterium]